MNATLQDAAREEPRARDGRKNGMGTSGRTPAQNEVSVSVPFNVWPLGKFVPSVISCDDEPQWSADVVENTPGG